MYPVFYHLYNTFFFIHCILRTLRNLLRRLVSLAYLHYALYTVALAITTFAKIKCIFNNDIVKK